MSRVEMSAANRISHAPRNELDESIAAVHAVPQPITHQSNGVNGERPAKLSFDDDTTLSASALPQQGLTRALPLSVHDQMWTLRHKLNSSTDDSDEDEDRTDKDSQIIAACHQAQHGHDLLDPGDTPYSFERITDLGDATSDFPLVSSPSDTDVSYVTADSGPHDGSSEHEFDFPSPPLLTGTPPATPPPQSRTTPQRAFKPMTPGPFSTKRPSHPLSQQAFGPQHTSSEGDHSSQSQNSSGSSVKTATANSSVTDHPTFMVTFSLHPLSKHEPAQTPAIKKWMAKPHALRFYHSAFHVLGVVNKGSLKSGVASPKHRLSEQHRKSESDATTTTADKSLCEMLAGAVVRMRWVDERKAGGKDGFDEKNRGWPGRRVSTAELEEGGVALPTADHHSGTETQAAVAETGESHNVYQVDADVQRDVFGFSDAEDAVLIVRTHTASWFGDMAVELVESPVGLEAKDLGVREGVTWTGEGVGKQL